MSFSCAEKSVQIIWSSGGGRGGRGRKRRGKGQGSKGQLKSSLCTCSWHRGTCAQGFVNICFLLPRLLSLLNPCFPPCHVYISTPPPSSDGERSTGKNRWLVVNRRIAIRFVVKPEVRHDQNHQQVGIACSALQVLLYIHSGRKLEMVPQRTTSAGNLVFVDAAVNSSYLSSAGESYEILRAVLAQLSAIVFSHDKRYVMFFFVDLDGLEAGLRLSEETP